MRDIIARLVVGDETKYHFKDELAYTEDNILIYNLFVYNIPPKTTEKEALKYFSSFGKVKSVHLVPDKRKSRKSAPKIGFINYVNASIAASVLRTADPHILNSKQIFVSACDSWRQPFLPHYKNTECIDEKSNSAKKSLKITQLNDDCLESIFKKLQLKDQMRLALSCQRFKSVFEMICKSEYKNHQLDDLELLTLWESREFFTIAGPHIETLRGSIPCKYRCRIVEFIEKFCPNIKTIKFFLTNLKSSTLFKLFGKLQNCTVVDLTNCSLRDHSINALKKLPNLQTLSLADNSELTGKYLNNLVTVTDLVLYGCGNIQPTFFDKAIIALKDLKSLNIQLCERLKTSSLTVMLENSHKLESLKISCSIGSYESIARFPNLKQLSLLSSSAATPLRQELFEELVEHKANQLERLKIIGKNCVNIDRARQIGLLTKLSTLVCASNDVLTDECLEKFSKLKNLKEIDLKNCISITNEGLLQFVKSCTNLKVVNIQLCLHITDEFVFKVIKLLKSTQNQRGKDPCVFFVAMSGISSNIIRNIEYVAAKEFIQLSFFMPPTLGIEGDQLDDIDSDEDYEDIFDNIDDNYDFDDDPYDRFDVFLDNFGDDDDIDDAYEMFGGDD